MENTFKFTLQEGWEELDVSDLRMFGSPVSGVIHFEEDEDRIIVGIDEIDPLFILVNKHSKRCNWDWVEGNTFEEKCALRYGSILQKAKEGEYDDPKNFTEGSLSRSVYDRVIQYLERKEKESKPMKSDTKPELSSETLYPSDLQKYIDAGCDIPFVFIFKSLQPFIKPGTQLVHFKMGFASYNLHLEVGFEAPHNPYDPYFLKVIADLKNRVYTAYNYAWNGSIEDRLSTIKRPLYHMLDMDDIVDKPTFGAVYLYIATQLEPLCADGAAWNFAHDYIEAFRRSVEIVYGFDTIPEIPDPEYLLVSADENAPEPTAPESSEPQDTPTTYTTPAKQFECFPKNSIHKALRISENTTLADVQNFLNSVEENWLWKGAGNMFAALTPGKVVTINPLGDVMVYSEEDLHLHYLKAPADEI